MKCKNHNVVENKNSDYARSDKTIKEYVCSKCGKVRTERLNLGAYCGERHYSFTTLADKINVL